MQPGFRLGLSLSGGGYRATAFHLGTLRQLQKMNILSQVDVLSTISGGSITGAAYCIRPADFEAFDKALYEGLQRKNVVRSLLLSGMGLRLALAALLFLSFFILLFLPWPWPLVFPAAVVLWVYLFLRFQFRLFPVSKSIEKIYDSFFFQQKKLPDLHEKPALVIGSTNMDTARPFIFSRDRMFDSTYEYSREKTSFTTAGFPVARAVMASTCVPFAFTPVTIAPEFYVPPERSGKVNPQLVDGGVYDNQGIHKILQQGRYACNVCITSDAGAGGNGGGRSRYGNTLLLLIGTMDVFMDRIKNVQMVDGIYENARTAKRQIAYFSLAWDVERCIDGFIDNLEKKQVIPEVVAAHQIPDEWLKNIKSNRAHIKLWLEERTQYDAIPRPGREEKSVARRVNTNLTTLSKQQVDCLIKQAAALTELQVKLYCPILIQK